MGTSLGEFEHLVLLAVVQLDEVPIPLEDGVRDEANRSDDPVPAARSLLRWRGQRFRR